MSFLIPLTSYSAAISPEKFSAAASGLHSPQVEISYSSLSFDSAVLNKRISSLKRSGFGGVLLTSIPAGSNSWIRIAGVAESCRKYSMKLGCEFFTQVDNPVQLYRVVSTNRIVNAGQKRDKLKLADHERLVTEFMLPASYSNNIQRAFVATRKISAGNEEGVAYSFKAVPFDPPEINFLDRSVLEGSVNKFLLNAQMSLGNNYGTVFGLVRFPALKNNQLVWADNLPKWFIENVSFDFVRNIPVLAWTNNTDLPFVKNTRKRYQRGIKRIWQMNFADHLRPLVYEAGLNAAIAVNPMTLPPEEYADFFQFPLASGSTSVVQRALNRRTTGGARIYECSRIMGRIDSNSAILGSVIDALFADGVNTLLFSEKFTAFEGSNHFDSLTALCNYVNRCSYVLLNSEPAEGILLCSDRIPQAMNRMVFDSVTPRMLKSAEINNGRVFFTSGRSSSIVVFGDAEMKANKALADKLRSSGISVVSLSSVNKLTPDLSWKSDQKNLNFSFVHRTGLDREYFLIKNESDLGGMTDLIFKISRFVKISRWQPQDGKIYEISKFRKSSSMYTNLSMSVCPGELFFVVFDH